MRKEKAPNISWELEFIDEVGVSWINRRNLGISPSWPLVFQKWVLNYSKGGIKMNLINNIPFGKYMHKYHWTFQLLLSFPSFVIWWHLSSTLISLLVINGPLWVFMDHCWLFYLLFSFLFDPLYFLSSLLASIIFIIHCLNSVWACSKYSLVILWVCYIFVERCSLWHDPPLHLFLYGSTWVIHLLTTPSMGGLQLSLKAWFLY